jgi:diacylglycerol O-acyltransferase / wax synthase
MINFIVTNVPGPPVPLYVAGARIDEVMPLIGTAGNVTVVFAALSYCGRISLVVNADAASCPDIDVLADGMEQTCKDLVGVADRGVDQASQPVRPIRH